MVYCVGCIGGSGSGKTFLVQQLIQSFKALQPAVLCLDDYYFPKAQQQVDPQGAINFDLPTAIDLSRFENDLKRLKQGLSVTNNRYTYNTPSQNNTEQFISASSMLIVEGLYLAHYPTIMKLIDYLIFVEVDHNIQLQRRIERDSKERNYPEEAVLYQWNNHVLPSFHAHISPYKRVANFIWHNNSEWSLHFNQLLQNLSPLVELQ